MRPEARRTLRDLRWIAQAEAYVAKARTDLMRDPDDRVLAALIRMAEEVIENEREKLAASSKHASA